MYEVGQHLFGGDVKVVAYHEEDLSYTIENINSPEVYRHEYRVRVSERELDVMVERYKKSQRRAKLVFYKLVPTGPPGMDGTDKYLLKYADRVGGLGQTIRLNKDEAELLTRIFDEQWEAGKSLGEV